MQSLEQELRVLILSGQLYAQMDEAWRLNELYEAAECDQLRGVHLDLSEARDQSVGELVVAGEQAEGESADGVRRPCLE